MLVINLHFKKSSTFYEEKKNVAVCVEMLQYLIIAPLYAQRLWGHIDLTPWSISMGLQQSTGLH